MTVYQSGGQQPKRETLFVNVFGPPKTGKTSFAFSFPGPFYYQRLDRLADKIIRDVLDQCPDTFVDEEEYISDLGKAGAMPMLWARFEAAVTKAIKEGAERDKKGEPAGTFIVDGGHRMWDICQETWLPAEDDRDPKKKRLYYAIPNEKYSNLLLTLEASPLNVVIAHHTRNVYDSNGKETENVKPDGFKRVPYLDSLDIFTLSTRPDSINMPGVRASMVSGKETRPPTQFFGHISVCAYDAGLEGKTLKNPNFGRLYELIFAKRWAGGKLYTPSDAM